MLIISKKKIIKKKNIKRIINIYFINIFIFKILFILFSNIFGMKNSQKKIFMFKYNNNNFSLLNLPKIKNNTIFLKGKEPLLNYISIYIKKNITQIIIFF